MGFATNDINLVKQAEAELRQAQFKIKIELRFVFNSAEVKIKAFSTFAFGRVGGGRWCRKVEIKAISASN